MRARVLLASATIALSMTGISLEATAEPMDPALERLVLNPACHQLPNPSGGVAMYGYWNPLGGGPTGRCMPDNIAFKRLVNQYGAAMAPTATHSARTTGYGGFELTIEGAYTSLDRNADYMVYGTRGSVDPSTNNASIRNNSPDAVGQVYQLQARKGFPFGLEIAALIGYMAHTSFMTLGSDIRMSLLEGFRTGALGYAPDFAVGGGVRTATGSPQLQLTTVSVDGQFSKPIAIADSSVLTPYVGYQYLWIFGDSGVIDTTPNTDPLGLCGYAGANIPGTPGAPGGSPGHPYNGQPVCNGGSALDFNNTFVFDAVRLKRQRLMFGFKYRVEMVTAGIQYLTDLIDPSAANGDDSELAGVPRQFTISLQLGAAF